MRYIVALLLALWPACASAEWLESQSENFVVYSDDDEASVRKFSEQLELYHAALEAITGKDLPPPSPSARVTVYMVKNESEVSRLFNNKTASGVAGFYMARLNGPLAIVPKTKAKNGDTEFGMVVLLHEYAHHFTTAISAFPIPLWMAEGSAEFFASTRFPEDGGIIIGMPAQHRVMELRYAADVVARELVDPEFKGKGPGQGWGAFYGKSWLLYHYLAFDESRTGQMRRYAQLLSQGVGSLEAAGQAFGDLLQLERDLDRYWRQPTLASIEFKPGLVKGGDVAVSHLSEGESAIMPIRIRSKRGVDEKAAAQVLADAREVAARYPYDPGVLSVLAEAEYDAGNSDAAIAAADRALEYDPSRVNAYVQKGYALFRMAADADDKDAAYKAAVKPFLALNKIEPDHPVPLVFFYRSFSERGATPPEIAVMGLEHVVDLAPFDTSARMLLAIQQIQEERFADARRTLVPLAFSPHGGPLSELTRKVVDRIDAGDTDDEALIAEMTKSAEDEAETGSGG